MKHTRKMILVPVQDGGSDAYITDSGETASNNQPSEPRKINSIRKYAMERQQKLLNIVLKLALKSSYDSSGRMRDRNGSYTLEIAPLLLHALSPGRSLRGMDRFVKILFDAGVTPEEIINVNVKEMLRSLWKGRLPPIPEKPVDENGISNIEPSYSPSPPPQQPQPHSVPLPPPLIPMVPADDPRLVDEEKKRQKRDEPMDYREQLKRKRVPDDNDEPTSKRYAWDTLGN